MSELQIQTRNIKIAYTHCLLADSDSHSIDLLRDARNQKYTWIGPDENQLRFLVDRHLREHNCLN